MDQWTLDFTRRVPKKPGARVLEVGSLNVNGSVRPLFTDAGEYIGIDIRKGKDVDRVMAGEDVVAEFGPESFDIVLSSNTLEHCEHWREVLQASWDVLKTGGVMCIVTPTPMKGRHNYPSDYWRWTLTDYGYIFRGQRVIKTDKKDRCVGIIVEKVDGVLRLNIEPYKVP